MSRILVVEDDTDIASLIVHYLSPPATIGGRHDRQRRDRGARRTPPDLVILDRMLPGLDGLEICRGLRADPELTRRCRS